MMLSVPLPFIIAGVLALLFVHLLRNQGGLWFLLFVGACAVQAGLIGLRWSEGFAWVHYLQPVLAACLPGIALTAFESLGDKPPSYWHLFWPVAVVIVWLLHPALIDSLLVWLCLTLKNLYTFRYQSCSVYTSQMLIFFLPFNKPGEFLATTNSPVIHRETGKYFCYGMPTTFF